MKNKKNVSVLIAGLVVLFNPLVLTATVHNVAMMNFFFSPDTLVVFQDDTVRWINQSSLNHTTTSGVNGVPDSIWDSGLMAPGDTFIYPFLVIGNYPYYCTPHWQLGMIGLISVIATGVEEDNLLPVEGRLTVNYPSVIRNGIDFIVNEKNAGSIELIVYDSRGELVFKSGRIGTRTAHWDLKDVHGRRVNPGAYFIRVTAGGKSSSGKLVLIE